MESLFANAQQSYVMLKRNLDEELNQDMGRFTGKVGMLQIVFLALEKEGTAARRGSSPATLYSLISLWINGPVHFSYSSLKEDASYKLGFVLMEMLLVNKDSSGELSFSPFLENGMHYCSSLTAGGTRFQCK